ncbi:MAG: tetrahydrofolate dehydrogenase/cyclohydrolase catalytic domain-containing protein [Christensenellales bacterium]
MPLIKGGECAKSIRKEIEQNCLALKAEGVAPKLAILRVGRREDDIAYERSAMKKAEQVGIEVHHVVLEEQSSTAQCLQAVQALNDDPSVHGILLFRPLPRHIDEERVVESLLPEGHHRMTGKTWPKCLWMTKRALPLHGGGGGACWRRKSSGMEKHRRHRAEPGGGKAAVYAAAAGATRPCHSKTAHLPEVCANADILVAAVGRAKMVNRHYVKPGAVVVDVGINVDETGALCGDVDTQDVEKTAAVTPVPGGLGGVTSWLLLEHVVRAAQMRRK